MIFECGDLERALRSPELMPDARAHAETCEHCRAQLYLWTEISRLAPRLHQEWESPSLWPRIQASLDSPARRPSMPPLWRWALAAAAAILLAAVLARPWRQPSREFLTEDALRQVEQAEAAYAHSIENLSRIAAPQIERSPSPLAGVYREKLLTLDSAIAELKAAAENNRYNIAIETQLASLYREKQKTLLEWLDHAKRNSSSSN
jgi:hypothetical protein